MEVVLGSIRRPDVDIAPFFRDDEMWARLAAARAPVIQPDFPEMGP